MKNKVTNLIESFISEEEFSGSILIKQGEEILYNTAHGYAHRGFKVPNNTETKFDCAGITKLFTAVSIFQLIDEDKLNLTDSLETLLNLGNSKIEGSITVEQLLTHTSGIGEHWNYPSDIPYEEFFESIPNYSINSLHDMLNLFSQKDADFNPGEKSDYNNCGYILLGLIIEKITGMSYATYVQVNIFNKHNMCNSGFFSMVDSVENLAEGYDDIFDEDDNVIGFKKNIYSYPPQGFSDRGAYVASGDLCRFIEAFMNGEIVSKNSVQAMITTRVIFSSRDGNDSSYGYGFELVSDSSTSEVKVISKSGINHGVTSLIMFLPKFNLKVVILTNSYSNIWSLSYRIMGEFFEIEERC